MWSCSNGRSEEEDQLRRRHKLGDRSEWESEFLNKHGRYSLSPVRDDYKTLDAKCVFISFESSGWKKLQVFSGWLYTFICHDDKCGSATAQSH